MSHQSQFRLRTVCQAGRSTVQLGGPVDGLRRDVSGGRGGGGHVAIAELRLDAAQHLCHPGEGLEGGASLYRGASEEGSEEGSETAVELHTHTQTHTIGTQFIASCETDDKTVPGSYQPNSTSRN